MTQPTRYRLGPATLEVRGEHALADWLRELLSPLAGEGSADMALEPTDEPCHHPSERDVGHAGYRVGQGRLSFDAGGFDVSMAWASGEPLTVRLRPQPGAGAWRHPRRAVGRWLATGGGAFEAQVRRLGGSILPVLVQLAALPHGASLIPGGSFMLAEDAVLLPGWPASGRVALVNQAALVGHAQFLGGIWALIDQQGRSYPLPLPVELTAARLGVTGVAERVRETMGRGRRLQWRLSRSLRGDATRWVMPGSFYPPPGLGSAKAVSQAILLYRGQHEELSIEPMEPADAARCCVGLLSAGLGELGAWLGPAGAGWSPTVLPSVAAVLRSTRGVYESAFGRMPVVRVAIPEATEPRALAAFVRDHCPVFRRAMA